MAGLIQLYHEFMPYDKTLLKNDPALLEFIRLIKKLEGDINEEVSG